MNKLEKARCLINEADETIRENFVKRMHAVEMVIDYKKQHDLPIYDEKREQEVLMRNLNQLEDLSLSEYYKEFLEEVFRISKQYQNACLHQGVYGYQGMKGAFSQIATSQLFPEGKQKNYSKFEDVILAVLNHDIEKGVLPFENSTTGEVGEVIDLLYRYDVKISACYDLKVDQNLLGIKGSKITDLTKVYSKLEALEQCEEALKQFDFERIPYANTALAAKYVSETNDRTIGAIASKQCAKEYGLEILMENLNTDRDNTTRFIVIENELPNVSDKIMILLTLDHKSGALAAVMQTIADYKLNMTSIRSRACRDKSWQYYFYIEIEGDIQDPNIQACFEKCKEQCEQLRVIGCVKEKKTWTL